MENAGLNRRDFQHFLRAVGGLLAGALLGGTAFGADEKAAPKDKNKNPMLASRTFAAASTCKGLGSTKDNACGESACAMASAHLCHYKNECRGEGGCGGQPAKTSAKARGSAACRCRLARGRRPAHDFEELDEKGRQGSRPAPRRRRRKPLLLRQQPSIVSIPGTGGVLSARAMLFAEPERR